MENPYPPSDVIKGVRWLTEPMVFPKSLGDVWSCAWGEDGHIYSVADDTGGLARNTDSNLAVFKIEGNPPHHKVSLLNPMKEYGGMGQIEGMDTWKANGMTCIDGVLYLSVSQHSGAGEYPDCVQRVYDASIVRSEDHGKTWSAKPLAGKGMFPGPRFATPFFVQFGQNGQGAMDNFIYAVSSSGTWNNGNYMVLGRVKRNFIWCLRPTDWEFFHHADDNGNPVWTSKVEQAGGIFKHRGFTSMTGIQWVPAVERFIMGQWAYANLDQPHPWGQTMLCLYEAPKPWGPWKHFHIEEDWGQGRAFYNPSLPAKWFEDGGKRMWMTMAGDFCNHNMSSPRFSYGFTVQKMELILK
jgi:hypothetical protein